MTADPVDLRTAALTLDLDPLRPVSTVHHWVAANARFFVKVARDDSVLMGEAIEREAKVAAALGIPARTAIVQGRVAMVTPRLGEPMPLRTPGALFVAAALDALESYRRRPCPASLPDGDDLAVRVQALTETAEAPVRQWALGLLDAAGAYPGSGPQLLVHTDAHRGNWVVGPGGLVALVDWESAAVASVEVDVAALAISRLRVGDESGTLACGRYVGDVATYRWALAIKGAEAGVWIARIWGEGTWREFTARLGWLLSR